MNNFKKEKIVINQILNEQFAGPIVREVAKGLAKEAPAAAKEVMKTAGREVVAGAAADAVRSANSTTQTPPQITEIPPELVPILRPRSKPEDKPEPNSTNTPNVEDGKSVSSVSAIERFGIPILGELLRLKLGFNPLAAFSPQSQSGTATKTATATATKDKEQDLTAPSLLNIKSGITTPKYGYSSTKFASEVNPIFQRETGSQTTQTSRGERRRALSRVPVEESQKPGGPGEKEPRIREFDTINPKPQMPRGKDTISGDPGEKKPQIREFGRINPKPQMPRGKDTISGDPGEKEPRIREFDTINPEPQMPRGKDTISGDPTPTEIAAKMRDVLIRQRSLRTKEKYSSRANENTPIKNIDHSAIHHPQIDGPINPGTA